MKNQKNKNVESKRAEEFEKFRSTDVSSQISGNADMQGEAKKNRNKEIETQRFVVAFFKKILQQAVHKMTDAENCVF